MRRQHEIFKKTAHDYTIEEAVEEFKVTKETIHDWCKKFRVKLKKTPSKMDLLLEGKEGISSARLSLELGIPLHIIKYHRWKQKSSSL